MSAQLAKLPALSSRQLSKAVVWGSVRQLSSSSVRWNEDDGNKKPQNGNFNNKPQRPLDPESRRQFMSGLVRKISQQHSEEKASGNSERAAPARGSSQGPPRDAARRQAPQNSQGGPQGGRAVDARAFGAQGRSGGGGGGKEQDKTASASLQDLRERLRGRQRRLVSKDGKSIGPGKQGGNKARTQKSRERRPRRRTNRDSQQKQTGWDEATKQYLIEKQQSERPKPIRYDPEPYNFETLKRTWPSIPIGESAGTAASVRDKLTWYGERYVESFETPHELADRILDGKRVMFASEEEKAQVIRLTKELVEQRAQNEADKDSAAKLADVEFQPLTEQERTDLIGSLVAGHYDKVDTSESQPGTYATVQKNLGNNASYYHAQSDQFMEALSKYLPKDAPKNQNKAKATR